MSAADVDLTASGPATVAEHPAEAPRHDVAELSPLRVGRRWRVVCAIGWLIPGRGVTARVAGRNVAVFVLEHGELVAIDDVDPFSGASVLSRGLVGDAGGVPTVASPVYKQRFDLRTGRCLDDESVAVQTWPVRLHRGRVEVAVP